MIPNWPGGRFIKNINGRCRAFRKISMLCVEDGSKGLNVKGIVIFVCICMDSHEIGPYLAQFMTTFYV